ncbi:MAG: hypothetical protein ACTSV3_04960 [Candidatus Thorarchaeota archaeon]|nr:MAG: hypothetical protein DRP09_08240 [Candidatus Thorarchaeota archaeon]RLI59918.1 MAG: hypothetical protein DRO87_01485 [Candidatus Thorarchaeota archaeon]
MIHKDIMTHPRTLAVLIELGWGDRFEKDLEEKTEDSTGDWSLSFERIRDELIERGLVYRLRGGQGSPYLALTDEGQRLVGNLQKNQD